MYPSNKKKKVWREEKEENTQEPSQVKKSLSEKVSLYRGDITLLEVDAIVNAGKSGNGVACNGRNVTL
ncbi:hypothetical protein G4228_015535 [Cervus hanglu yarkandensis]|nr:hypothetical protein G4228_015535 [Cervus hanglu yarkandensis]